jgi:hypothetical protein
VLEVIVSLLILGMLGTHDAEAHTIPAAIYIQRPTQPRPHVVYQSVDRLPAHIQRERENNSHMASYDNSGMISSAALATQHRSQIYSLY